LGIEPKQNFDLGEGLRKWLREFWPTKYQPSPCKLPSLRQFKSPNSLPVGSLFCYNRHR